MSYWNYRFKYLIPAILFLSTFLYLLDPIFRDVNIFDEALQIYGAMRVLNGDIPYRDFWAIYSPGQFYVLAALFKLFGPSLIVERIWDTLIRSLLALTVYLLSTRVVSRRLAALPWLVTTIWLSYCTIYSYPAFPAFLFCLISIYLVFSYISEVINFQKRDTRWLIAAGITAGIAAVFRHDFGFYIFTTEIIIISIFSFLYRVEGEQKVVFFNSSVVKPPLGYMLGMALFAFPISAYFLMKVPFSELVHQLVIFPATVFPDFRSIPYPSLFPDIPLLTSGKWPLKTYLWGLLKNIPFYFHFLVFPLAVLHLWRKKRMISARDREKDWLLAMLLFFGLLTINQVLVRSDEYHLIQTLVLATIIFSALINESLKVWKFKPYLTYGLTAIVLAGILADPLSYFSFFKPAIPSGIYSHGIERARHVAINPMQAAAVEFIQNNVEKNESIYVGNTRHDKIFINDVMFYFLSEHHSATKYHELHPGSATTLEVQKQIVADIERNRVRYIVLKKIMIEREQAAESGANLLDDFIKKNYRIVERFGTYFILKRTMKN